MASLIRYAIDGYNEFQKNGDPRMKNYFMMSSPLPLFVVLALYLYFVTDLGPRLMKDRPPMNVDKIMIVYNAMQVAANALVLFETFRLHWLRDQSQFLCIEVDYADNELGRQKVAVAWVFMMCKCLDLLDTVFFILRKKFKQASFLHIYHHTMVAGFGWFVMHFYPGGHPIFFATLNSFVHTVMYSYYLYTALNSGKNTPLWWKKYLTQLQLVQFVLTGAHASLALFRRDCNYPKYLIAIGLPQDIFIMFMFWDFYKKTYTNVKARNDLTKKMS